jgi:hypothetical protein
MIGGGLCEIRILTYERNSYILFGNSQGKICTYGRIISRLILEKQAVI